MQVGIVGLPNVGKSTLFKALTKKQVDVANYPFCTIDPNVGVVEVPDSRLDKLTEISKSKKTIPTSIEFVDIAGLVKGAHAGEGLGNQFLSHIREVDAIVEVLRDFEDSNIAHVEGSIDPKRDGEIISLELIMADLQTIEKRLNKATKEAKSGDKQMKKQVELLKRIQKNLEEEKVVSSMELSDEEKGFVKGFNLLTSKPIIYVYNIDEKTVTSDDNKIYINAKLESELAELSDSDAKEYLKELGIDKTGLDKLILQSYKTLDLVTFLTSGEPESRAWTVRKGALAPEAAGVIHTDFVKGFIRAEVVDYDKFIENNGWTGAKEKGQVRLEGKEYPVKDGDVIYFKVATG